MDGDLGPEFRIRRSNCGCGSLIRSQVCCKEPAEKPLNLRAKSGHRRRIHRGQIAVGVIGVGPMWERRYRSAVNSLSDRFSVRVVYDAVLAKAQVAAAEVGAEVAAGLRQVFERTDLHAVLVLDTAWYDLFPAELACLCRKPTFLAGSLGGDLPALAALHQLAVEHETLLMTEFSRRYTPATTRLRELIATQLGEARQVNVAAVVPVAASTGPLPGQSCERDYLAGLLDWCQYITGRVPTSLLATPQASNAEPWEIELGFRPDPNGRPATTAKLQLRPATLTDGLGDGAAEESSWPFPRHQIICERGAAQFAAAGEICWQNGTRTHSGIERLVAERTDAEVMLDQFSRRVLGGLVPVADVQDVCRVLALVAATLTSRATGRETRLAW